MKQFSFLLLLAAIVLTACEKTNTTALSGSNKATIENTTAASDTVKIPLTDMGSKTYLGFTGGLYPNGANQPSGQYAKDLQAFASSIIPLDTSGKSSSKGIVGFISIGGSTGSILIKALKNITTNNPLTNPKLRLASGSDTGASVDEINDTVTNMYWQKATAKLLQNGVHIRQVEVVYVETEDTLEDLSFPFRAGELRNKFEKTLRILKTKFPNIKLVYFLGRTTTFLPKAKITVIGEPAPYYNGWACKFTIQDQINGKRSVAYKGNNAVAALSTWGWYEWSVPDVPRKDGFIWTKDDTTDGLHANTTGAMKLANHFQNFLLNDPYASIWYAKH
jgi:hypothetical protein